VVAGTCKGSGSAESTTNSELHSSAPVAVQTGVLFAQLGSRGDYTCGVQVKTGVGYCWGSNYAGQVGDATTTSPRLTPTRVAGAL
jgi:hypothetical protein